MRAPISKTRQWVSRILWLVGIWLASVAALGVVALVLRAAMRLAGLTS